MEDAPHEPRVRPEISPSAFDLCRQNSYAELTFGRPILIYVLMVPSAKRRRKLVQLAFLDAGGKAVARPKKPRRRTPGVKLGRKPRAERVGFVVHETREAHDWRHPVHVSMHRVKLAPSLRSERVYQAIVTQLARVKTQGVRVVHYSVQHDHLHLIVEGQDRHDVSNQMRKLFSRIALAVNGVAKRRGSLFRDRHHRRELTSPRATRSALVYVLFNERKHSFQNGGPISEATLTELDDKSSVAWLTGWAANARPPPETLARLRARYVEAPVSTPLTWLASTGWRKQGGGAMRVDEIPRFGCR